jgi:hypothetical protein
MINLGTTPEALHTLTGIARSQVAMSADVRKSSFAFPAGPGRHPAMALPPPISDDEAP